MPSAFCFFIILCLRAPVTQVQEIIPNRSIAQFGDRRLHTLELIAADSVQNSIYEFFIETRFHTFLWAVSLVNH
jgi:hypothetical protein